MKTKEKPTICIKFQGDEYSITGEIVRKQDYIDHDVECPVCKDAYSTYESAQKALKQRTLREARNKRIYKCNLCGCYHFTTNDGYTHKRKYYDRTKNQDHLKRAVASVSDSDLKTIKETLSQPGSLRRFVNAQNLRSLLSEKCA